MASAAPAANGRVIQITGPVVDIEFPAGKLPSIFNAVEIERPGQDSLVCEVQQHLGNNWVRSVAMTTTDGLARGVAVRDTGAPITVPVGEATLGRVFDVLGRFTHMEVDPYSFASALNGVVAQRLVRLNCPHCAAAHQPPPEELEAQLRSTHDTDGGVPSGPDIVIQPGPA